MKLSIKNFAKIKEATIIIDGITVIAGENNTGKSTVGKILFSLFNALSDVDEKILEERLKEIENTNSLMIQNYIDVIELPRNMIARTAWNLARKTNIKIKHQLDDNLSISDEKLISLVENTIRNGIRATEALENHNLSDMIEEVYRNVSEILNLPEEKIILEIISRYFNSVFHSQMQSLSDVNETQAMLALEIKGKKEQLFFEKNYCRAFVDEINIIHKAIYIDNPFIVDECQNTMI